MVFSSAIFLFFFLPAVFVLERVFRDIRVKNALLTAASLVFYAFGEPVYVLLMIFSAVFNYAFGLLVSKGGRTSRAALAAAVIVNIGALAVFKYTDFLIGSINGVFGLSVPLPGIKLPIGISFFTFQALSYVIDVYRDNSLCQRSFLKLMLYISFFPQLIAGPIVKYGDIAAEIGSRHADARDVAEGLRRFVFGLAKKLLIANALGRCVDAAFSWGGTGALVAWTGALFYCLQIYYDFSGYSDMAIGLGRVFGFHFKENFDHPYACSSLRDFWRRWHISLSGWFRDYLYIPLGGSRRSRGRTVINRYIVFFLTGLWHGASWTFVIWGLLHGTFLLLEDLVPRRVKSSALWRVPVLLLVVIAFVIFRADDLNGAWQYITSMFTFSPATSAETGRLLAYFDARLLLTAAVGVVCALPVKDRLYRALGSRGWAETATYPIALLILALCVMDLASSTFNPFIYFRF